MLYRREMLRMLGAAAITAVPRLDAAASSLDDRELAERIDNHLQTLVSRNHGS
jgi:hypothetical protein